MTETTQIRELTLDETDAVTGGRVYELRLPGVDQGVVRLELERSIDAARRSVEIYAFLLCVREG